MNMAITFDACNKICTMSNNYLSTVYNPGQGVKEQIFLSSQGSYQKKCFESYNLTLLPFMNLLVKQGKHKATFFARFKATLTKISIEIIQTCSIF